jgi:hypothetical protein
MVICGVNIYGSGQPYVYQIVALAQAPWWPLSTCVHVREVICVHANNHYRHTATYTTRSAATCVFSLGNFVIYGHVCARVREVTCVHANNHYRHTATYTARSAATCVISSGSLVIYGHVCVHAFVIACVHTNQHHRHTAIESSTSLAPCALSWDSLPSFLSLFITSTLQLGRHQNKVPQQILSSLLCQAVSKAGSKAGRQ